MFDRRRTTRRRRRGSRRGTSMIEFIMVLPLLATVIAATFFFGWAMTNQQHVRMADRYVAWRRFKGGDGPTGGDINDKFMDGRARNVSVGGGGYRGQTRDELLQKTAEQSYDAGPLMQEAVGHYPGAYHGGVGAAWDPPIGAFQHLNDPIRSDHYREGREWRRIHGVYMIGGRDVEDGYDSRQPVSKFYITALDERMPGDDDSYLARVIRVTYVYRWHAWSPPPE